VRVSPLSLFQILLESGSFPASIRAPADVPRCLCPHAGQCQWLIKQCFPHGMPTTNADTINADLLAFLKGAA